MTMNNPITIYQTFFLGDMQAQYLLDQDTGGMELRLFPAGMEPLAWDRKRQSVDSLVQAHVLGDDMPGGYAGGVTMRQSGTTMCLRFTGQQCMPEAGGGLTIETELLHPSGCVFVHHLSWDGKAPVARMWTSVRNDGAAAQTLELLSSFSLGGLSPFCPGAAPGVLRLHRLRSAWSMEGRLCSDDLEALNLEPSWARFGVRCERFGQVGSMPVNGWFPWMALEDRKSDVLWGCQLACPGSWQMEVSRQGDGVSLSGGLADFQYGHWQKTLLPGDGFTAPEAYLTVCQGGGLEEISHRLTSIYHCNPMLPGMEDGGLPLIFNEYCATWGCPTEESVARQLAVLKNRHITYFVIDSGWFKPETAPWDTSLGDYEVSADQFPQGLGGTVAAIAQAGMVPGIWFEPETIGRDAKAYRKTEHQLKRFGQVITTQTRRFWDLRDPWVQEYLDRRVVRFLKEQGFGYVKLDYNDSIGVGCDGAESLGEGLRQNLAAGAQFLDHLRRELPQLVVESCASGGHRLDPYHLLRGDFSSFSDAHECAAIPIVAANLHRVLRPWQAEIWAVLRKTDSKKRIGYSLCAAMLGCMCLSGDVTELSPAQWEAVDEGLAFYRSAAPVIRSGRSHRFGPSVSCYDTPEGWQGVCLTAPDGRMLLIAHRFGGAAPETIRIPLPEKCGGVERVYDCCGSRLYLEDGTVCWQPAEEMSAVAVLLLPRRENHPGTC